MIDFKKLMDDTEVEVAAANAAVAELPRAKEPDVVLEEIVGKPTPAEDIILSSQQEEVWEVIQRGGNVLVTGSAGTGKSTILRALLNRLPHTFHITASTGIAAVNVGGLTIYSWAGLGKGVRSADDIAQDIIDQQGRHYFRLKTVTHLAIDEISMLPASVFELLDGVMRIVRKCDEPFGGVQLILFGDFLQLPPVVREQTDVVFTFQSPLWKQAGIQTMFLTKVYRQADERFSTALNDIRRGFISSRAKAVLQERFEAGKTMAEGTDGPPPVIIHTRNVDVDDENQKRLDALGGEAVVIKANDFGKAGALLTLQKHCLAPAELKLKVGARVMLLKNIDPSIGLANGSTGVVEKIEEKQEGILTWKRTVLIPHVKFDVGPTLAITKAKFETIEDGHVAATREQLPLRLAWSITTHKSQGMTLDRIQVYLSKVFEDGQAYVALSRARTLEGLFIMSKKPGCITANPRAVRFYFGDEEPTEPAQAELNLDAPSDGKCDSAAKVLLPRDDREERSATPQVSPVPIVKDSFFPPDDDDDIPMVHEGDRSEDRTLKTAVEEMITAIEEADSRDAIAYAIRTFRKLYPR